MTPKNLLAEVGFSLSCFRGILFRPLLDFPRQSGAALALGGAWELLKGCPLALFRPSLYIYITIKNFGGSGLFSKIDRKPNKKPKTRWKNELSVFGQNGIMKVHIHGGIFGKTTKFDRFDPPIPIENQNGIF